jgi:hypothetical protein
MNIFEIDDEIKKIDTQSVLSRERGPLIRKDNGYQEYREVCQYYKEGKDLFVDVIIKENRKIFLGVEKGIGSVYDSLVDNYDASLENIKTEIKKLIDY